MFYHSAKPVFVDPHTAGDARKQSPQPDKVGPHRLSQAYLALAIQKPWKILTNP